MEFKYRIDSQLEDRLTKWHSQIDILSEVERRHLEIDCQKDLLFAAMFLKLKEGSIAEKTAQVHASSEWGSYIQNMTEAKVQWLREKRVLELKMKAYEATYLTYKIESDAIRKSQ